MAERRSMKRASRSGQSKKSARPRKTPREKSAFEEYSAWLDKLSNEAPPAALPFAIDYAIDQRTAKRVGDKCFSSGNDWLWHNVKRPLIGIHSVVRNGKESQAEVPERLLFAALFRQRGKDSKRLYDFLDKLFTRLLPRVLLRHSPLLENNERVEFIKEAVPKVPDSSPQAAKDAVRLDREDLDTITRILLAKDELLARLLALHFLHPKSRRSGRDKICRRPLFNALDELLAHAAADHFFRKLRDVLAFEWDEIKHLRDEALLREVYRRAGRPIAAHEDVATPLRWLNRQVKQLKLR